MLDESLLTLRQAEGLVRGGQVDLFNIRVSKNGGLVQSLRLAQLADRMGLDFQLGCMVGAGPPGPRCRIAAAPRSAAWS